ncbi:hypothetical protein KIPB_001531 [Kipferlia bialata]|uniref:Uncharacterized protein n=1 Tax=Kipferlia bialata TaxID=797122 RepID=A0A391NLW4_9EUKA|nr:hypothetical protein KIPB_001531 [Kipferlia bialata]|eukprot:g1531.t1
MIVMDDRVHILQYGRVSHVFSLETGWETSSTCPSMNPPSGTTLMPMGRHIVSVNRYTGDVAGYNRLEGNLTPWGKWWTTTSPNWTDTGRITCCRLSHKDVLVVGKCNTSVLRFQEDIVCPEAYECDML